MASWMQWLNSAVRNSGVMTRTFVSTCDSYTKGHSPSYRVCQSTSHDVHRNLALEDWLYSNYKVNDNSGMLLFWRNSPCVVIGRHQNPWLECDLSAIADRQMALARRKSGGGTVYHDLGNLNLTFITTKKKYNRRRNLDLIANALREKWNLDVSVSDRDDIILNTKYKISGTASKLGRLVAYHHCTLLFDVNRDDLENVLQTRSTGLQSRATESVKAEVTNMCEIEPSVTYEALVEAIAKQYLNSYHTEGVVEQLEPTDEKQFPGLETFYKSHQSWDWLFGKTPKFSVSRSFHRLDTGYPFFLDIDLTIERGLISEAKLSGSTYQFLLRKVEERIVGSKIWPRGSYEKQKILELGETEQERDLLSWISQCFNNIL